jgi:hypothetical protein
MTKTLTLQQVKELIDRNDPVLLFAHGVPEDEYAGEAYDVHEFLEKNPNLTHQMMTEGLRKIFVDRFSASTVEINPGVYEKLANEIQELLKKE